MTRAAVSQIPQFSAGTRRYWLNRVIIDLARAPNRAELFADKASFIGRYPLQEEDQAALLAPDWRKLLELGVLPNLIYKFYMLHGLAPERFTDAVAGESTAEG